MNVISDSTSPKLITTLLWVHQVSLRSCSRVVMLEACTTLRPRYEAAHEVDMSVALAHMRRLTSRIPASNTALQTAKVLSLLCLSWLLLGVDKIHNLGVLKALDHLPVKVIHHKGILLLQRVVRNSPANQTLPVSRMVLHDGLPSSNVLLRGWKSAAILELFIHPAQICLDELQPQCIAPQDRP